MTVRGDLQVFDVKDGYLSGVRRGELGTPIVEVYRVEAR